MTHYRPTSPHRTPPPAEARAPDNADAAAIVTTLHSVYDAIHDLGVGPHARGWSRAELLQIRSAAEAVVAMADLLEFAASLIDLAYDDDGRGGADDDPLASVGPEVLERRWELLERDSVGWAGR